MKKRLLSLALGLCTVLAAVLLLAPAMTVTAVEKYSLKAPSGLVDR